jgi:hypothetical protein
VDILNKEDTLGNNNKYLKATERMTLSLNSTTETLTTLLLANNSNSNNLLLETLPPLLLPLLLRLSLVLSVIQTLQRKQSPSPSEANQFHFLLRPHLKPTNPLQFRSRSVEVRKLPRLRKLLLPIPRNLQLPRLELLPSLPLLRLLLPPQRRKPMLN